MKHEKGREGEITDTADTSKHSEETQQGKAAQHRQRAEEPNMLWDYTVGLVRAVFKSSTFCVNAVCKLFNKPTIEDCGKISLIYGP